MYEYQNNYEVATQIHNSLSEPTEGADIMELFDYYDSFDEVERRVL